MDGLKTQEDAVPSKDWMKTTEETNRDKGDDSSSRNCKESRYWAKAVVEKDASSIDNQHSADMAKIDLQAHPSYKGNQKSMGLLRIEVEKGPSTMDDQHSTDLMKVDLETKLSIGCDEHSIDLTQIEDEAERPSVDDQHRTDSIKMEVEEGHDQHPTDSIKMEVEEEHDQRPTDSIKMEVEEEHVQRPTDSIKMEEEEVHDQRPTDSIKMEEEEEHCTVDGQQKDAGERESAARVNKGPIRWVKIEVQTCAGDNQKVAKLVKMEDADEPSSEFPQDSTDLVKLEARKETYSEVCQDSSCLMKFEEEDPLSRDSLGDMAHVKTEEFDGPFHKKSPGLIKWVMFKTEADPFSRDSQDCEGGRSDNSAAVQWPNPRPLDVQNETRPERPSLEGRLTRKVLRDVLAELAAKEDALGVGAELVRLRHPSLFFSGEVHCNGVAKIILMKPGSAPLSRNVVKGKNPDSVLPEHQTAAVEDQYKDVAGSPDCHEDDPCSSDTESSGTTEISSTGSPDCHEDDPCSSDTESSGTGFPMIASVIPLRGTEEEKRHSAEHQKSAPRKDISCNSGSPDCHEDDPCSSDSESSGTGFPMIASVISLRGTEEEKRHSAEHQESAPRKDISCNSELPLITSVYTLRGTEDASKHQESVLRSNINCNAGVPAVSLLFIGNVLQPLMTPLNTQTGQPAVSVMTVGDQRQPLMLPPNPQGSAGVAELGAGDPSTPAMKTGSELQPVVPNANNPEGGADPSVKIVLNKLTDLPSPASTQKQERIAKPDEEFPVITSVFTLRDTEEEDLQSVDNPESKRSEDVNFDSGIPMITAVFTLRDEEELQQAKRREKVTKRKESMAQDPGNLKPEGSRKMKYSSRYQVGPGPYTCSVCGRIFVHFNLFSRHEATHKVLKHHKCPVCGDTFNQKYRLLAHKKTHTVKPRKYMPFILPKPTF